MSENQVRKSWPRKGRVTTSDDATLRLLHERYAQPLWRYVFSLTRDSYQSEDIVQETLLKAWNSPRILDEPVEEVRGWMFTVARNLVIDQSRSARSRHERSIERLPEEASADHADQIFDEILIHDALAALSEPHRQVVVLAYYGACSTPQIAAELGIADGTVKSRLHYGMRALKLALQERGVTR